MIVRSACARVASGGASRARASRAIAALVAFAASSLASPRAHAVDGEVTSDTAAQFYDVRSPTGETVLARRRVTTTLGVAAYHLLDDPLERGGAPFDPAAPELTFRARLRYDTDFGRSSAEIDPGNTGRFVPGLADSPTDLMYGYVEGRRFARGWLSFRLGRQYVVDPLGFYSFDGAEAKLTSPFFLALEGYAGLEVRSGMPLSSPRFDRDGVWRGDRSNFDPSLYPSFQDADVAPVVGIAAETAGVHWVHARVTYRRVVNTGESVAREGLPLSGSVTAPPLTFGGARISQEQAGASLDATFGRAVSAKVEGAYDVYLARAASVLASADVSVGPRLTLSADYDYVRPTYDADSIWNFFAIQPMNDVGLRAVILASDRLSVSGGGHVRIYTIADLDSVAPLGPVPIVVPTAGADSYAPITTHPYDAGFDLAARYRWREGWLAFRGSGNFGGGGDRVGADASVERLLERRYLLEGRLSLWQWRDGLRSDRDATSFGYVAGVGYRFAPRSEGKIELEHDMNRLVGQRVRAMLWLRFAVAP